MFLNPPEVNCATFYKRTGHRASAQMITRKGIFGIVQGHQNRHLSIDPSTGALFVGVGSSGNLGVEPEPKASIQRFDADGSNQTTFASACAIRPR